jgi:IclR family acetate operon transcriptional repressor
MVELGTPRPLHSSAAGKLLLAHMSDVELDDTLASLKLEPLTAQTIVDAVELRRQVSEVRAMGYALSAEESCDGVFHVATPFFDAAHQFRGAVALSVPRDRFLSRAQELIAKTLRCSKSISERLGCADAEPGGN